MLRTTILGLALCGPLAAASAAATEYTLFSNLCLPEPGRASEAGCTSRALLNLPQGWLEGDGAVALLTIAPIRDAPRDPLVASLLGHGLAVLEIVPAVLADEVDDTGMAREPHLVDGMLRALAALKRVAGAGPVVAIGLGTAATRAVGVLSDEATLAQTTHATDRFVAVLGLGDGPPVILRNGAVAPQLRLAAVCEALAAAGQSGWAEACYPELLGRRRPGSPMAARLSR